MYSWGSSLASGGKATALSSNTLSLLPRVHWEGPGEATGPPSLPGGCRHSCPQTGGGGYVKISSKALRLVCPLRREGFAQLAPVLLGPRDFLPSLGMPVAFC